MLLKKKLIVKRTLNVSLLFSLSFGPLYEYASSSKLFKSSSLKFSNFYNIKKEQEKITWH